MVAVRRHSPTHLTVQVTIAGRGLYVNRTADGAWWKIRLRKRCRPRRCGDWPDQPPDTGVREPRHPQGPRPSSAAAL